MAGRNRAAHSILRSISLSCKSSAQSSTTSSFTRSLITQKPLQSKVSTNAHMKFIGKDFFTIHRHQHSTSKIIRLLQKRPYHNDGRNGGHDQDLQRRNQDFERIQVEYDNKGGGYDGYRQDMQKKIQRQEIRRFAGDVIVGLLVATSVTVYALKQRYIALPEFIVSKYPKLKDIEGFIHDNFTLSQHNVNMGRWWTLIGSSFDHASFWHILMNMAVLWNFRGTITRAFGPLGLLLVYAVGGACGGILGLEMNQERSRKLLRETFPGFFQNHHPYSNLQGFCGASASILALTTGLTIIFPHMRFGLFLVPRLEFPAWGFAALTAIFSVYAEATGILPFIGHWGHLGGMTGGAVLGVIFRNLRRRW